jgi:hypothetical protein
MWFPAPGKLAVSDGFGNVGVPRDHLTDAPDMQVISPERGPAGLYRASRGLP